MKNHKFHSDSSKINFFEMLIELCNPENESSLLEYLTSVEEGLDIRYMAEMNLAEFLRYCINLTENGEFEELRRILTGKINKSVSDSGKKPKVISIHSFKRAI